MLSPAEFREIISGRNHGAAAWFWRALFSAIEPFYAAVVGYRNRRFDLGRAPITRVEIPVVSVGNLTLGGTGKTPMVEWLSRWFQKQGLHVALVSRGYGGVDGQENDEARELRQKLPDVPHLLNPRRSIAAREAIDRHSAELIILDDGFQHRRLARDLDIVLIDALEPFGFDHVFPRGTLREPLIGLARAAVVALSRADAVDPPIREAIRRRVETYNSHAVWLELSHVPRALRDRQGHFESLDWLRGKRVLAFCGIGNPAGFVHVLEGCQCEIAELREFPDHHAYTPAEVHALETAARDLGAEALICTHKDLVKLEASSTSPLPVYALEIGMQICVGQTELEERLQALALLAKQRSPKAAPAG